MIEISLTVSKAQVYNEVAKTTSYAGQKMVDDDEAYNRIFVTDEDMELLERFWNEACAEATNKLKPWLVSVSSHPISNGVDLTKNYVVLLSVSGRYDTDLTGSVNQSLYSYFVLYITGKWYMYANKPEAEAIVTSAAGYMEDVLKKIYYKKKPVVSHDPDPDIDPNP